MAFMGIGKMGELLGQGIGSWAHVFCGEYGK